MKLEVGMYVRTRDGFLWKPKKIEIEEDNSVWFDDYYDYDVSDVKASHNIIDLIEEGDILEINNEKYEVIYDESYEKLGILIPSRKELSIRHSALEYVFKKYNVSIVTKEQFESMSYKVGE